MFFFTENRASLRHSDWKKNRVFIGFLFVNRKRGTGVRSLLFYVTISYRFRTAAAAVRRRCRRGGRVRARCRYCEMSQLALGLSYMQVIATYIREISIHWKPRRRSPSARETQSSPNGPPTGPWWGAECQRSAKDVATGRVSNPPFIPPGHSCAPNFRIFETLSLRRPSRRDSCWFSAGRGDALVTNKIHVKRKWEKWHLRLVHVLGYNFTPLGVRCRGGKA